MNETSEIVLTLIAIGMFVLLLLWISVPLILIRTNSKQEKIIKALSELNLTAQIINDSIKNKAKEEETIINCPKCDAKQSSLAIICTSCNHFLKKEK